MYDANGNPLNVGLSVGGSYLDGYYATWDELDRQERRVDYAGNATLNRFNALGQLAAVTGPDGYTVSFDRDPMGRHHYLVQVIGNVHAVGGGEVGLAQCAKGEVRLQRAVVGLEARNRLAQALEA